MSSDMKFEKIDEDGNVVETTDIFSGGEHLFLYQWHDGPVETPEFKLEVKQNNPEHIHFWDTDRD